MVAEMMRTDRGVHPLTGGSNPVTGADWLPPQREPGPAMRGRGLRGGRALVHYTKRGRAQCRCHPRATKCWRAGPTFQGLRR